MSMEPVNVEEIHTLINEGRYKLNPVLLETELNAALRLRNLPPEITRPLYTIAVDAASVHGSPGFARQHAIVDIYAEIANALLLAMGLAVATSLGSNT